MLPRTRTSSGGSGGKAVGLVSPADDSSISPRRANPSPSDGKDARERIFSEKHDGDSPKSRLQPIVEDSSALGDAAAAGEGGESPTNGRLRSDSMPNSAQDGSPVGGLSRQKGQKDLHAERPTTRDGRSRTQSDNTIQSQNEGQVSSPNQSSEEDSEDEDTRHGAQGEAFGSATLEWPEELRALPLMWQPTQSPHPRSILSNLRANDLPCEELDSDYENEPIGDGSTLEGEDDDEEPSNNTNTKSSKPGPTFSSFPKTNQFGKLAGASFGKGFGLDKPEDTMRPTLGKVNEEKPGQEDGEEGDKQEKHTFLLKGQGKVADQDFVRKDEKVCDPRPSLHSGLLIYVRPSIVTTQKQSVINAAKQLLQKKEKGSKSKEKGSDTKTDAPSEAKSTGKDGKDAPGTGDKDDALADGEESPSKQDQKIGETGVSMPNRPVDLLLLTQSFNYDTTCPQLAREHEMSKKLIESSNLAYTGLQALKDSRPDTVFSKAGGIVSRLCRQETQDSSEDEARDESESPVKKVVEKQEPTYKRPTTAPIGNKGNSRDTVLPVHIPTALEEWYNRSKSPEKKGRDGDTKAIGDGKTNPDEVKTEEKNKEEKKPRFRTEDFLLKKPSGDHQAIKDLLVFESHFESGNLAAVNLSLDKEIPAPAPPSPKDQTVPSAIPSLAVIGGDGEIRQDGTSGRPGTSQVGGSSSSSSTPQETIPRYELILDEDTNSVGNTQWFYFATRNTKKGQTVEFSLVNLGKSRSLYEHGLRPLCFSMRKAEAKRRERRVREALKQGVKRPPPNSGISEEDRRKLERGESLHDHSQGPWNTQSTSKFKNAAGLVANAMSGQSKIGRCKSAGTTRTSKQKGPPSSSDNTPVDGAEFEEWDSKGTQKTSSADKEDDDQDWDTRYEDLRGWHRCGTNITYEPSNITKGELWAKMKNVKVGDFLGVCSEKNIQKYGTPGSNMGCSTQALLARAESQKLIGDADNSDDDPVGKLEKDPRQETRKPALHTPSAAFGNKPQPWSAAQDPSREGKPLHRLSFRYTFEYDNDIVYFCYTYPYTFTRLHRLLTSLNPQHCYTTLLCRTLSQNPIDVVTVTDRNTSSAAKSIVFITSRVHPGETPSSFIMEGLLRFLTSSDRRAAELRQHFIFKLIPMLNPDGTIVGNYRTSLAGADLNRRWRRDSRMVHPGIYFAKRLIRRLSKDFGISCFLDLHGHSRKFSWFTYGVHTENLGMGNFKDPRMLPYSWRQSSPTFSLSSCSFATPASKEQTARITVWRDIGILSYTIEASLGGGQKRSLTKPGTGDAPQAAASPGEENPEDPEKLVHYIARDYLEMGRDLALGFLTRLRKYQSLQKKVGNLKKRKPAALQASASLDKIKKVEVDCKGKPLAAAEKGTVEEESHPAQPASVIPSFEGLWKNILAVLFTCA